MVKTTKIKELQEQLNELESTCLVDGKLAEKVMMKIRGFCTRFYGNGYVYEKLVALETSLVGRNIDICCVAIASGNLLGAVEQYGESHEIWLD